MSSAAATMPMQGMPQNYRAEGAPPAADKGGEKKGLFGTVGGWADKLAGIVDSGGGGAAVFEKKYLGFSIKDVTNFPDMAAKAAAKIGGLPFYAGKFIQEYGLPPFNLAVPVMQKIPGINYITRKTKIQQILGGNFMTTYLPEANANAKTKSPETRFWNYLNYYLENVTPYKNKYNSLAGNTPAQQALLEEFERNFERSLGSIGLWNIINGGGSQMTTFSDEHSEIKDQIKIQLRDYIRGFDDKGNKIEKMPELEGESALESKLMSLRETIAINMPPALSPDDDLDISINNLLIPLTDKLKASVPSRAAWEKLELSQHGQSFKKRLLSFFVEQYNAISQGSRISEKQVEDLILDRAYDYPAVRGTIAEIIENISTKTPQAVAASIELNKKDSTIPILEIIDERTTAKDLTRLLKIAMVPSKAVKQKDPKDAIESVKKIAPTREEFIKSSVYKTFMNNLVPFIMSLYKTRTSQEDIEAEKLKQIILDAIYN